MVCAYFYVIALIAVTIVWGKMGFINDPAKIVDSIPMLAKTLIGVGVGILAVFLAS